ncbi:hypothetical protein B0H11DRAFT_1918253 [Mycena galericulata]|nr:hypothetical protein B0H11DRAFT_1918253 [Mycena galericulata]
MSFSTLSPISCASCRPEEVRAALRKPGGFTEVEVLLLPRIAPNEPERADAHGGPGAHAPPRGRPHGEPRGALRVLVRLERTQKHLRGRVHVAHGIAHALAPERLDEFAEFALLRRRVNHCQIASAAQTPRSPSPLRCPNNARSLSVLRTRRAGSEAAGACWAGPCTQGWPRTRRMVGSSATGTYPWSVEVSAWALRRRGDGGGRCTYTPMRKAVRGAACCVGEVALTSPKVPPTRRTSGAADVAVYDLSKKKEIESKTNAHLPIPRGCSRIVVLG